MEKRKERRRTREGENIEKHRERVIEGEGRRGKRRRSRVPPQKFFVGSVCKGGYYADVGGRW